VQGSKKENTKVLRVYNIIKKGCHRGNLFFIKKKVPPGEGTLVMISDGKSITVGKSSIMCSYFFKKKGEAPVTGKTAGE